MKNKRRTPCFAVKMLILLLLCTNGQFAQPFMPLQINNRWQYYQYTEGPDGLCCKEYLVVSITDSMTINGKKWFKSSLDACWYSYDRTSDILYILVPGVGGTEEVNTDFSLPAGALYYTWTTNLQSSTPAFHPATTYTGTVNIFGGEYIYRKDRVEIAPGAIGATFDRGFVRGVGAIGYFYSSYRGYTINSVLSAVAADGDSIRYFPNNRKPIVDSLKASRYEITTNQNYTSLNVYAKHPSSIAAYSFRGVNYPLCTYLDQGTFVKSYYFVDSLLRIDSSYSSLTDGKVSTMIFYDSAAALQSSDMYIFANISDKSLVPNRILFPSEGKGVLVPPPVKYSLSPLLPNSVYVTEEFLSDSPGIWRSIGIYKTEYSDYIVQSGMYYIQVKRNSVPYSIRRYDYSGHKIAERLTSGNVDFVRDNLLIEQHDTADIWRDGKNYFVTADGQILGNRLGLLSLERQYRTVSSDSLLYTLKKGIGLVEEEFYETINDVTVRRKSVLKAAMIGGIIFGDKTYLTNINESVFKSILPERTISLFPNPANEQTTLFISHLSGGPSKIQIINMSGEVVKTYDFANLSEGEVRLDLNINDLSSGVYLIRFESGNIASNAKLVVIK